MSVVLCLTITVLIYGSSCATAELTDEQYYQLPKLFDLDDYTSCLSQSTGVYCMGSFELTPNIGNNAVYQRMKEYSANPRNFNHTRLHRGYCVSARCPELLKATDLKKNFQQCVDKWTSSNYGLSASLYQLDYCTRSTDAAKSTNGFAENLFCYVITGILILNIIGTLYDLATEEGKGNPYIIAWSLISNWKKLTGTQKSDLTTLGLVPAMRTLVSFAIIMAHVFVLHKKAYIYNPRYVETAYKSPLNVALTNGTGVTQVFMLIANIFLAYNIQREAEKNPSFGLRMLPKIVLRRVIRIFPSYWLMLGFVATWWQHLSSGPMWTLVEKEAEVCRQFWWTKFLIAVNLVGANIIAKLNCLGQTWSLAAEFQLYVVSAAMCLLLARNRHAMKIFVTLFIVTILILYGISYSFDFKSAAMVMSVERTRALFTEKDAMPVFYVSPWTSAPSSLLGVIMGRLMYTMHKKKVGQHKKEIKSTPATRQWQSLLSSEAFLIAMMIVWLSVGAWLSDQRSSPLQYLYTAMERPVITLLACMLIYGATLRVGGLWLWFAKSGIVRLMSRLSLWVLLLHVTITASILASRPQPLHISLLTIVTDWSTIVVSSYLLAFPLTLIVELPVKQFLQKVFSL